MKKDNKKFAGGEKALRKHYKDIQAGKGLPTLLQYFKTCVFMGLVDYSGLNGQYPRLYKTLKRQYSLKKKEIEMKIKRKN